MAKSVKRLLPKAQITILSPSSLTSVDNGMWGDWSSSHLAVKEVSGNVYYVCICNVNREESTLALKP